MKYLKRYRWPIAGLVIAVLVVGFLAFRPDKLFVDDVVDESLDDAFAVAAEAEASTTTTTTRAPTTTSNASAEVETPTTTSTTTTDNRAGGSGRRHNRRLLRNRSLGGGYGHRL